MKSIHGMTWTIGKWHPSKKNQMLLHIVIYSIKSIEKKQRNLILYVIAFYPMLSIIR